jgi:UDP-N-acetylglucosamine 2-epimerase (non-hydrolysing)
MHILHVVGARPNFMKAAPVLRAFSTHSQVSQALIHTGQHYDANMSEIFFDQLGIPEPDVNLHVGSGSHAQQTAQVMSRLEPVIIQHAPDWVIVYGDVNSTAAAALVCAKLQIKLAHVEAGLRSFDRSMPEEINRIITDQLADLLLTPSSDGNDNLLREGIPPEKIRLVGNVMIDTLLRLLPLAQSHRVSGLPDRYALVTLHRPANVDDGPFLRDFLDTLCDLGQDFPVIFPVHPRTRQRIANFHLAPNGKNHVRLMDPLSYLGFIALQETASVVITDSGGIQEETTFLGVPCLTVRENTERPVTVTLGSNVLVGRDVHRLSREIQKIVHGRRPAARVPPLWDGRAAERIVSELLSPGASFEDLKPDREECLVQT